MRQIAPKLAGVPINVLGEESEGGDARQASERFDGMICGGRNAHSNHSKRGAKFVTRSLSPSASAGPSRQSPYCEIARLRLGKPGERNVGKSLLFIPAGRREKAGSESK
jgi:hypothetical protein